jgi:hypothetical protein
MDFAVLSEKDEFIKFLIERIAGDVLDNSWKTFVFSHHFEVNGIVGREIFVVWFYAYCGVKEKIKRLMSNINNVGLSKQFCIQ